MANLVELLPLLVVALLLLSMGGEDVRSVEIAVDGDRTVAEVEDVLIVGGGTATVPADTAVNGSVYVVGGDTVIAGTVRGDVVQLAGNLTVADGAAIAGELQLIAGEQIVEEGASVERRTDVTAVAPADRSPAEQVVFLAVQVLVLAPVGWVIARREPGLLRNVGHSITEHGVVSGTVGLLAGATGVALVVFMALTLILLPVSLLAILVGVVVVGYAYVAFGHLIGRRLPVDSASGATVAGIAVFVAAMAILGRVPVIGAVVQIALVLTGVGAVLITYFGLREFQPPELPE